MVSFLTHAPTLRVTPIAGATPAAPDTTAPPETPASPVSPVTPEAPATETATAGLARGWDPAHDAGTDADLYVDASVAVSGDGTTGTGGTAEGPFRTVTEAVAAAVAAGGDRVIAIRAGTYREKIDLAGLNGCTLKGYGTEKPLITAMDALNGSNPHVVANPGGGVGWEQCTVADQPDVGAIYPDLWKITIANAGRPGDDTALNIVEAGAPVPVSQTQLAGEDLFFPKFSYGFAQADQFLTQPGTDIVTGIRDTARFAGLTALQAMRAVCVFWRVGNAVTGEFAVTAFDAGTKTITIGNAAERAYSAHATNPAQRRYNLRNCVPLMQQGSYACINHGSTTTIYLWPSSAANLAGDIDIGARDEVMGTSDALDGFTLEGVVCRGATGPADNWKGQAFRLETTSLKKNVTLRHCLFELSTSPDHYGCVVVRHTEDFRMERCTVRLVASSVAISLMGQSRYPHIRPVIRQCVVERSASAAFRATYTLRGMLLFNTQRNTGKGSHSNAWNFYQGCGDNLIYGHKVIDCYGYATHQASGKMWVGMCRQDTSLLENGHRGYQSQEDSSPVELAPEYPSDNYFWNIQFLPGPNTGYKNSVNLGKPQHSDWYETSVSTKNGPMPWSQYVAQQYGVTAALPGSDRNDPYNMRYIFVNCIAHGGGVEEPYTNLDVKETHWSDRPYYTTDYPEQSLVNSMGGQAATEYRRGNLYTGRANWQKDYAPYNWSPHASELVQENLGAVYTSAGARDFTAPAGSPILSGKGVSLTDIIARAEANWPGVTVDGRPGSMSVFRVDADGLPIPDVTAPRRGCFQSDYNAQIAG
jgi:hypothetical protein